ncbi:MAG: DUF3365 domain-containing protein [Desulfovibrionaceae bacterium]
MSRLLPHRLQAKFLLGLGTIVLVLGVFFAASLYFHLSSLLQTQVREKADLVLGQVDAVQAYVRETLRPKMYEVLGDQFIIEAMSTSFVSHAVMDRFNVESAEYHYRRVAENARNPKSEIDDSERDLLEYFRANRDAPFWSGQRKINGAEHFVKARPVTFKGSCLHCHGVAEDSPPELLERYGSERGFGHIAGAVDGIVLVGVPVERSVAMIREATVGYVGLYATGVIMFFTVIQFFFNRLVVHNLKRLTDKFRTLFQDQAEITVLEKLGSEDEIEEIVQGMEELGDHLHSVQQQLKAHSGNLEQMVEERTSELTHEAQERRADVRLFVQLVDGLNRSSSRRELWSVALPLVARRFGALEASFACMLTQTTFYSWPSTDKRPEMPEDWKEIMMEVRPRFEPTLAYIPVTSSDAAAEGLLILSWPPGRVLKEQDRDVLRALGQQLGIAMENLTALHNLLRQKDMLQAIVEGISDPLLLMDASCGVVLVNEAARALAATFGDGENTDCSQLFARGGVLEDCPLRGALEQGQAQTREARTQDGRTFSINIYPVTEGGGEQTRVVVYIREITQEKRMLSSMQRSEKLATVGRLAAGLAHEINNPLGVIKCYAELLRNSDLGEQQRQDLQVILKHAGQAQNVLQDLLNFARPKQAQPVPLDLAAMVREAARIFQVQAEKKGALVDVSAAPGLPLLTAHPQHLEQILANLFSNALDAVEPGQGRINVRIDVTPNNGILLRVADNGPGIPEENARRLFDPFFTTKEMGQGTGLGLAIVYGIVVEMGGRIEVENNGGAVFTIHLPVNATGAEKI